MRMRFDQLLFLDTLVNSDCNLNTLEDLKRSHGLDTESSDFLSKCVTIFDISSGLSDASPVNPIPVYEHTVGAHIAQYEQYGHWIPRIQEWVTKVDADSQPVTLVEGRFKVTQDHSVCVLARMGYSADKPEGEQYTILSSISTVLPSQENLFNLPGIDPAIFGNAGRMGL